MRERVPVPPRTIDMTTDGEFVAPVSPQPQGSGLWALRLGLGAAIVAAVAGALVVAALVIWVASVMIPVALIAGVVAYGAFRFQIWRAQRSLRH
jgi:hypothetical protein